MKCKDEKRKLQEVKEFEDQNEEIWAPTDRLFDKVRPVDSLLLHWDTLKLGRTLSKEERTAVQDLPQTYSDVFDAPNTRLGCTFVTQHKINRGDHPPVSLLLRRLAFWQRHKIFK